MFEPSCVWPMLGVELVHVCSLFCELILRSNVGETCVWWSLLIRQCVRHFMFWQRVPTARGRWACPMRTCLFRQHVVEFPKDGSEFGRLLLFAVGAEPGLVANHCYLELLFNRWEKVWTSVIRGRTEISDRSSVTWHYFDSSRTRSRSPTTSVLFRIGLMIQVRLDLLVSSSSPFFSDCLMNPVF